MIKVGARVLLGLVAFTLLGVGMYSLPPVRALLDWRIAEWKAQIKYAISPPEEMVFIPQEQETVSAPTSTPTQPLSCCANRHISRTHPYSPTYAYPNPDSDLTAGSWRCKWTTSLP